MSQIPSFASELSGYIRESHIRSIACEAKHTTRDTYKLQLDCSGVSGFSFFAIERIAALNRELLSGGKQLKLKNCPDDIASRWNYLPGFDSLLS